MREFSVSIEGVRSLVMETGPVDADEAAVFIHGNPGSIRDWQGLVRGVGEFGRALAMEMPGFGGADKPADFDYSVPGYASFLGRLLAKLSVRRAHLVMHDFGGPWGLAWGADNPQAVATFSPHTHAAQLSSRAEAHLIAGPATSDRLPKREGSKGVACHRAES